MQITAIYPSEAEIINGENIVRQPEFVPGGSQNPLWYERSFFRRDGESVVSAYKNRSRSVFLPDEKNSCSCCSKAGLVTAVPEFRPPYSDFRVNMVESFLFSLDDGDDDFDFDDYDDDFDEDFEEDFEELPDDDLDEFGFEDEDTDEDMEEIDEDVDDSFDDFDDMDSDENSFDDDEE